MSVILIDTDGTCFCSCASKCVLERCGSSPRCTKAELEEAGFKTIQVVDKKSEIAVHEAMCNDGKTHKLKIKDKKI